MPQPVNKILKVLFDIKPVDDSGRVDVAKIQAVSVKLDLRMVENSKFKSQNSKFFFGTWDEEVGVRDLALVNGKKETPLKGASSRSLKTRRLYSKLGCHQVISPLYSRTSNLSTTNNVDKPEAPVDSTGLAPVTPSGNQGYLLHNTTGPFPGPEKDYHEQIKKQNLAAELEKYLSSKRSVKRELKTVGAKVEKNDPDAKPRIRPIFVKQKSETLNPKLETRNNPETQNSKFETSIDDYQPILAEINQKVRPVVEVALVGEPRRIEAFDNWNAPVQSSPEIESWVNYAQSAQNFQFPISNFQSIFNSKIFKPNPELLKKFYGGLLNKRNLLVVGVIGFSAFVFSSFGQYRVSVKNEVVRESNLAVANLEQANESLRAFDFEAASNNFAEAYEEFSKAGDSLNFMGASITSLFAELPGAGKLKSAKNLVEAGKLLAEAGKSMSDVPLPNLLDVETQGLAPFKRSLLLAQKNLVKVNALLSDVSLDALPEDKKESFSEFQSKLPELEKIVSDAVEYTAFLENLLGSNGNKKYLVLFQNNSELRPTGGFPGTYAVVTFKDGRLDGFLVDDVYNLDGQLKENIIPPKPLRHITPNWGMRDANWFIDFSVSAQKAMEFFGKEAGYEVDGVITMSPRVISDILKVVGPIEMPEYGYAVNHENFLSTIQAEVEYGDNRQQPKTVVMDLAPRLLERIYLATCPGPDSVQAELGYGIEDPRFANSDECQRANRDRWLDIFNVFVSGLDKKDILMYFKDLKLESFVADKGLGGLIEKTDEDYLMVTFSNVKGSKTDGVTDNSITLNSKFEIRNSKPTIIHKLTIIREHNGGFSRYGFYNKQNPAYVRVLVPEGSELINISGNDVPSYRPLISYTGTDFKQDNDLFKLESGFYFDSENGVSIYKESGKTGFAFWLITDPGKRKTVELEYAVPLNYNGDSYGIYIQKQPGLEVDNFEFKLGDAYIYNGKFEKDLRLTLTPNQ